MRDLIQKWLTIGVKNPQDDERLYDIVIKSSENKADLQDFVDANNSLGEKFDVDELYHRYEDLYCFMKSYQKNSS